MYTVADKTALLQSQDWYLIRCVTCTFHFKMSLALVKMAWKQKAALRTTHVAQCSFGKRKDLWKNVKFLYKITIKYFYFISPSPSNWNMVGLHVSGLALLLLIRAIHSYVWSSLPTSKNSAQNLVPGHFRIFCLQERFILQNKFLL